MDTVGKKVRKTVKAKPFLLDEIITLILSMLPPKKAIMCALVCKKWKDIILTRKFVDLHLKNSIPVILVTTSRNYSQLDLYALDKWWKLARTMFIVQRFPFHARDFPNASSLIFSHAGLIVLKQWFFMEPKFNFTILNPDRPSNECVAITLSKEFQRSEICAIYYHPSLNEYCSLWKIEKSGPYCVHPEPIEYKLRNLGFNPSLKTIRNPFSYRVKDKDAKAVFINNYLYWMVKSEQEYGHNDILECDIISEKFMVIPFPVSFNIKCMNHQTHLLNSDGILSFLLILPSTITILKLEDHAQKLWTAKEYTISIEICHIHETVGIIAFVDGLLAYR